MHLKYPSDTDFAVYIHFLGLQRRREKHLDERNESEISEHKKTSAQVIPIYFHDNLMV